MRRFALILLSIAVLGAAVAAAADKEKNRFSAGRAETYPAHQTADKVTIAAVPFTAEDQVRLAFDKVNPNKYGVLPVLAVIDNGTGKTLRLDMKAEFVTADGRHLDATPAEDVIYIDASHKPPKIYDPNPIAVVFPKRDKKGPLNVWEIPGRAFTAKLLPPGESASGFFYFQTANEPGAHLYLTGVKDAASGKEYFYFEVPFEK